MAKEYSTERLRNVVVVGHGGSGKSSLVDALSFVSGTSPRHGKVADGSALTMYRSEEKTREMSLYVTPAFAEWEKCKINLLDTPGYLDFFSDVHAGIRAADAAILVVAANGGVEVGTLLTNSRVERRKLPRMVVVTKMDKEGAKFDEAIASLPELGKDYRFVQLQLPIGKNGVFDGVVDVVSKKAFKFSGTKGEFTEIPVPANLADDMETLHVSVAETAAEQDEALMEKYFGGEALTREEIISGLSKAVLSGSVIPVFCAGSETAKGMRQVLDGIVDYLPNPAQVVPEKATIEGETYSIKVADNAPLAGLVFKVVQEPHVGELVFFRLYAGTIINGGDVYNATQASPEKFGHLSISLGRNRVEVDVLHAGDIGVIAKMRNTHTNDTFGTKEKPYRLEPVVYPIPDTRVAIKGATQADDDKLGLALAKLREEDPTFYAEFDGDIRQTIANGLGDLHLQVQFEKLKDRFNVNVETTKPRIAYRETIRKKAEAQGRHKKQTGGKGQFGDCHLRLAPLARGEGYKFIDAVVGGVIPNKFIPAVDKGVQESAARGFLAGYPLQDFSCEVFFGSYHDVDSSEMAFKIAGSLGFQKACEAADPCLLEPIMALEITVPSDAMGDVSGDLSNRRGRIQGMDPKGDETVIRALAPEAELHGYAATLRAMTRGMGFHTRSFATYEIVPSLIADKVIAARKIEMEKEKE